MTTLRLQVVHSLPLRWCAAFVALFILSVPFPYQILPDIGRLFAPFFEILVRFTGDTLLGIDRKYTTELISDSTGLYIHALNINVIAVVIAALSMARELNNSAVRYWTWIVSRYYLALQLLIYGFSKVFKWQFYLPEPNTLFTTLGDVPRDLLYWTTMGSSHLYTVFGGVAEVAAALLLLFRRTSGVGSWVASAVLLNVVMINLSYNISVKLYSIFLFLLSLVIIVLDRKAEEYLPEVTQQRVFIAKAAIIMLLLFDSLFLYVSTGRYIDDLTERPPLHGAYDVAGFRKNDSLLAPLLTDLDRWRRVFVHRRGYFIVQSMDDKMKDFELRYDTARTRLVLVDPLDSSRSVMTYNMTADSTLQLAGTIGGHSLHMTLRQIDLTKLPLLRPEFNWTIDQE